MPSGEACTVPWDLDQIGPGSPDSFEIALNSEFKCCTVRNQGTFPLHVKFGDPMIRATTSDFMIAASDTVHFQFTTPGSVPIVSIYFTGSGGTENHYSIWLDAGDSFSRVFTYS